MTKGWPRAYGTPKTASMNGGTSLVAASLSASSLGVLLVVLGLLLLGELLVDVGVLDPQRVALAQAAEGRGGAGVERRVVQPVEVEVLVLQRVGELVDEGDLEADGHLRAAHADALVGGVVEGQRAAVDHAVEGLVEVELARRHAEGPQLAGVVVEVGPLGLLGRPAVAVGRDRGVLGRGEEVDVHRDGRSRGRARPRRRRPGRRRGDPTRRGGSGPSSSDWTAAPKSPARNTDADRDAEGDEPAGSRIGLRHRRERLPRVAGPVRGARDRGRAGAGAPTGAGAAAGGGSSRMIR